LRSHGGAARGTRCAISMIAVRPVQAAILGVVVTVTACTRKRDPSSEGISTLPPGVAPAASPDAAALTTPQPVSPFVVVDQFGYRPGDEKVAVVRSPRVGFDAPAAFAPDAVYAVVDAHTGERVMTGPVASWHDGAVDASSGDVAWHFDFSSMKTPGEYFVLDAKNGVRSDVFRVAADVYAPVLQQAMRFFYYQRDGMAKEPRYAGAAWADGIAHPQDAACRLYMGTSAPRDLHGGWIDAGDQSKYTNFEASDVVELLRAYVEAPAAFGDDSRIPESDNGVPDILDEAKWAIDWLARMQSADGSVLSIVSHVGASPVSADASACKYGPASTSTTLSTAAAFAFAARVFGGGPAAKGYPGYAEDLAKRAEQAWSWAAANPAAPFHDAGMGLGSGVDQELDDDTLHARKLQAASMLFVLTRGATYRAAIDGDYRASLATIDAFHSDGVEALLEYARAPGATPAVAAEIVTAFETAVEGPEHAGKHRSIADPYMAWLPTYTWGSNETKSREGNLFDDISVFAIDPAASAASLQYAERYVHYIHGVNPLGLVYLSNMGAFGARASVTRFFDQWFAPGSRWEAVGASKYGPPPGYLVGGPNPSYTWDACCPSNCGRASNNAKCGSRPPSPPAGQPDQKSYKDFGDGWPLDSWSVSEPDDAYQASYVRLLAKFTQSSN
jgi:endoglucanase